MHLQPAFALCLCCRWGEGRTEAELAAVGGRAVPRPSLEQVASPRPEKPADLPTGAEPGLGSRGCPPPCSAVGAKVSGSSGKALCPCHGDPGSPHGLLPGRWGSPPPASPPSSPNRLRTVNPAHAAVQSGNSAALPIRLQGAGVKRQGRSGHVARSDLTAAKLGLRLRGSL